ncbi:MAG TPA: hypothetical protein VLF62_03835 [Candidatus Saccharimonadales bacterium]|nr:hypothetical protein [Candidatus Saccharimonadales bacterium]
MPLPEGITVARLMPDEAAAAARPLQAFLAASYAEPGGMKPDCLPSTVADPNNPDLVGEQQKWIASSGNLSGISQEAYILAVDTSAPTKFEGIVGVGIFSRIEDAALTIDTLRVSSSKRRERVGTAIMHAAFRTLGIDGTDELFVSVSGKNDTGQQFLAGMGMERVSDARFSWQTGMKLKDTGPQPENYVVEYHGLQPVMDAKLRERLGL